jgi:hypothetical protein
MALPGTEIHVSKEFRYEPINAHIRLVAGFEKDRLVYWAVENSVNGEPNTQLFGVNQYAVASSIFKTAVEHYL